MKQFSRSFAGIHHDRDRARRRFSRHTGSHLLRSDWEVTNQDNCGGEQQLSKTTGVHRLSCELCPDATEIAADPNVLDRCTWLRQASNRGKSAAAFNRPIRKSANRRNSRARECSTHAVLSSPP